MNLWACSTAFFHLHIDQLALQGIACSLFLFFTNPNFVLFVSLDYWYGCISTGSDIWAPASNLMSLVLKYINVLKYLCLSYPLIKLGMRSRNTFQGICNKKSWKAEIFQYLVRKRHYFQSTFSYKAIQMRTQSRHIIRICRSGCVPAVINYFNLMSIVLLVLLNSV